MYVLEIPSFRERAQDFTEILALKWNYYYDVPPFFSILNRAWPCFVDFLMTSVTVSGHFRRALEIRENALGMDHPDTKSSRSVLQEQAEAEAAEAVEKAGVVVVDSPPSPDV